MYDTSVSKSTPGIKKAKAAKNGMNAENSYALPEEIQLEAERKYGVDFSDVRVHDDDVANLAAAMAGARAFAHGGDIYLGEGESPLDYELMNHELGHVAQQSETGEKLEKWSLPLHDLIMTDAFLKALGDKENAEYTTTGVLSKEEKKKLEQLKKGSSWNDLMENLSVPTTVMGGLALGINYHFERHMSQVSHHGMLQFLHAQAEKDKSIESVVKNMKDWGKFCYKVHAGDPNHEPKDTLEDLENEYGFIEPLLATKAMHRREGKGKGRGKGDAVRIKDLFNGADSDKVPGIALGSFLHLVMDSFNQAHGQRTAGKRKVLKPDAKGPEDFILIGELKNVTDYGLQKDHPKGDVTVSNWAPGALKLATTFGDSKRETIGFDESVDTCAEIMKMAMGGKPWEDLEVFIDEVFKVNDFAKAGEGEKRVSGKDGQAENSVRGVPAQGRLFRKPENSIRGVVRHFTEVALACDPYPLPRLRILELQPQAETYHALLKKRIKSLNLVIPKADRIMQLIEHKEALIKLLNLVNHLMMKDANYQKNTDDMRSAYEVMINEINADILDIDIDLESLLDEPEEADKPLTGFSKSGQKKARKAAKKKGK